MKTTAFAVIAACLFVVSGLTVVPKSSAPFSKALKDAEIIDSLSSDCSVKRTSGNHRTNIMEKLDLHDVAALTRWAIANKLVNRLVRRE